MSLFALASSALSAFGKKKTSSSAPAGPYTSVSNPTTTIGGLTVTPTTNSLVGNVSKLALVLVAIIIIVKLWKGS